MHQNSVTPIGITNDVETAGKIRIRDARNLTVRAAHELTGIAAGDFSSIRQAKLDRFTIDRLTSILAKLGQQVEVTVKVHPPRAAKREVEARL